ncbi:MAG: putative CRISPR-associated protein [Symploca sp. SIO2E9]|nr:putative CRISPR-associated protein [Symploca sp. SIO2E9]
MRNTLLATVGTSLFEGNLKRLCETTPNKPENWVKLKEAYETGIKTENWSLLAKELLEIDPSTRTCGAEINTVEEIRKKDWLSLENLIFFVSDTPNGKATGEVLCDYFQQRQDLKLRTVEYTVIDELQDERPQDFKVHGLRNLVRQIGEYVQRFGGSDYVTIDATGGYKAQIAIALLMGQALDIPVFYKHERFSEIIDFPPLPISFDYDILGQNADLLTDFERGEAFSSSELGSINQKLRSLLTEVVAGNESLYELSPIGQIYLTGFRYRNPYIISLTPAANRKAPTFRLAHYPNGFKDFVKKVWEENNWIVTSNSLPYDGQKGIKGIGFFVREEENSLKLIGTYQDKNKFGAKFRLHLTDESAKALAWAADYLNQKYKP